MADLSTDIQYIKGVGPKRAQAFNKLGVYNLGDLLSYFPRDYEDRRVIKSVRDVLSGETVCISAIVATQPRLNHVRKGLDLVKFKVYDNTGEVNVTFFNQAYIKDDINVGNEYVFYGKFSGNHGRLELANPDFELLSKSGLTTNCILPIYKLSAGLTQKAVSGAVRQGLDLCADYFEDPIPQEIRNQFNLASARFTYENIHFPEELYNLESARKRLVFEELFVLTCAMGFIKRNRSETVGRKFPSCDMSAFYDALPFKLTSAQLRAINDALKDMTDGISPMSRLVQGDVGSGKTVVAAACCWICAQAGCQSAVMAPTEILAMQHYETFSKLLAPLGVSVEILTGNMGAKRKREVLSKIADGEANVVVGTHALLSENVEFNDLALAVADEQHRFGVQQRAALAAKGNSPHVLVMSATPIPRTLALIIYGELDVSVIDERPPGRQNVDTFAVGESMRKRIYAFIRKHIEEGRQAYVVCPMVDESEALPDLKSAEEHAKDLQNNIFPDLEVGLIHGKMKAKDKDKVMLEFYNGEIDILVSTTVIEVGVDVPNAVIMLIENSERFGLSQLHQLRGRVGRGSHKSYCVMLMGSGAENASERLKAMCQTNDGFKIAETDLKLRGPGDFFGSRQHGLPEMRIASFANDIDVLQMAQQAAQGILREDPELDDSDHALLKKRVNAILDRHMNSMN